MILQPHKHTFRSILLVIFLASFALFLFVNFREQKSNTALGVTCPAGIAGQMDLCASTRIPHQGDAVQFTANTRQAQSGIAITIYIGGRPGADGYITNPQILTTGSTNSSGIFDFSYNVPSSDAWNTFHYFRAEATVGGSLLKSNQVALTVVPKTTDADWIVTASTYCKVQVGGGCTPINNSKPIEKIYNDTTLVQTGDVILVEDGSYSHFEFDRGCHSQTGPMIWVMARNVNGPVFNPNPVGSSDTIAFKRKSCWTSLVGLKIMGDDRAGVHFVTSSGNGPFLNHQFLEVTIDGGYNWYNQTGPTGKWLFQSYGLQGFRWIGGEAKNIGDSSVAEHAFYMHNPDTDATGNAVELRDVNSSNVGRTYIQAVNRPDDCSYANPCPPGSGNFQIEHAVIKNTGLEGGCTGGSSLTFGGRNDYNIVVSNVYVESGLDPGLSCKGTGEFVTWDGNNIPAENNGPTTIRNSYFIMAPNEGNKGLSEIGTVDKITIEKSTFISGKTYSLNAKKSATIKCFDRDSIITGVNEKRVTVDGIDYANYQAMLDALGDCGSSGGNPTVTLSATDANASETAGDPGTFTVSRTGSTANALTVKFSISGTATNGSDYSTISSPITIPVGASSATIQLNVTDDTSIESSETAILTLTSDSTYIIGSPSSGTVTIADNDSGGTPTVTLSATDASSSETPGDPGTYTITRTGATTNSLSVSFSVTGTATNGSDYTSIASPVTIPVGASSVTIQLSPIDDLAVESSETAILTLTSSSAYTIGSPNSGTVNITDNDNNNPTVTLSANDANASESAGDPGNFIITRTGATTNSLSVSFSVTGTATNGSDYTSIASPVTIPVGASSVNVPATITDDTVIESSETIILTLTSNANYTIGSPSSGTVTITDNDSGGTPTVTLSANDANASESAGDPGNFIITRTGATTNSLSVSFSVTGTATNGSDYTSIASPVTIPVGASSVNVPATITDDTVIESSETIILTLTSSASYIIGSPNTGTVTITDNDSAGLPTIALSVTDANASESGDPGTFVFTRTGSITSGLLIYISISGTATNGIDYPDLPSSILIPAGSSSLTIDGFPIDDTTIESSETVILTFIPDSSYTIGSPNSATITIADNDSTGTPTITINADDPTASELGSDTGIFTITRTGSTANTLTALFTVSGSAINGSDYQQMASSITIPSGSSYASLTLTPIDDSTVESTETAILTISSDSSYTIGTQNTATANILDNDGSSGQTTPPPTNNSNNTALSPAPSNFSGLALTPDKVYLSWNLISGASGIELSEGLDSVTFNKTYNLPGNYYYHKPSVTPGSTHSYRIRSYDSSGNFSNYSNIVQISTTNSVAQFTKSLYYGIDDAQVSLLQQCLKNDSSIYPSGKITGHFGPLTEAGVRKFQSKYGINPIGIVGPLTRAKLNASCGSVSTTFSSTPALTSTVKPVSVNYSLNFDLILGLGSSNDQVSLLQAILAKNSSLYPSGIVSGYYGPLTEIAVKNFQSKYSIDPSGTVGTKTITKLNEFRLSGLNP